MEVVLKKVTYVIAALIKFFLAYLVAKFLGLGIGYLLAGIFVVLGTILLVFAFTSGPDLERYKVLPGGKSAKLGDIPITLIDKKGRKIYVSKKSAWTLLDDQVIEKQRTWCELNGHSLKFSRNEHEIFVHWGEDLQIHTN